MVAETRTVGHFAAQSRSPYQHSVLDVLVRLPKMAQFAVGPTLPLVPEMIAFIIGFPDNPTSNIIHDLSPYR